MTSGRRIPWLIALVSVWIAISALRALLGVDHGLRAEYFDNPAWAGMPLSTTIDHDVSTGGMTAAWLGDPPGAFSVRWFGYVMAPREGDYTFATRSDDGSTLMVDGERIVDNGGIHSAQTRTGTARISAGPHSILIESAQMVGDYEIGFLWGPSATGLEPVPSWRLSPSRVAEWKILLVRALDLLAAGLLAASGALTIWIAFERRDAVMRPLKAYPRAACLALFVGLAIAETWPLAAHPMRLSRNDNGDTVLNEWALAWVAHQAPRDPLHLYDGNIFYPQKRTLAYSEAMIVQSTMAAPLLWLGATPVLAYNLVLVAGFALTGWAMTLVIAGWTASWSAGITSGILFAFNSHNFARMPHLQAQHVEFLPFALVALDALLRTPRPRHAVRLALWFALQALTSVYLLVFTAVSLTAAALARPEDWMGRRFARVAAMLGLAVVLAAVCLVPYLLPYWHLRQEEGLKRTLENAIGFAASWQNYLSAVSRIHYNWWSYRVISSPALFPGAVGLALTLVAILRGVAFKDPRARMCLAFGVAGVVLSFGANVPGYATLYTFVPMFQAIRAISRFGYLGIVAVAMVAGFGVVEIRRLLSPRLWAAAAVLLPALAAADGWVAPVSYTRFEGIPPIYQRLRDEREAIVLELPIHGAGAAFLEAPYMLNSTAYWHPILNGYSGLQPSSYFDHVDKLARFPDGQSIDFLRSEGVTHVVLHRSQLDPRVPQAVAAMPSFRKVSEEGDIVLYRLD